MRLEGEMRPETTAKSREDYATKGRFLWGISSSWSSNLTIHHLNHLRKSFACVHEPLHLAYLMLSKLNRMYKSVLCEMSMQ